MINCFIGLKGILLEIISLFISYSYNIEYQSGIFFLNSINYNVQLARKRTRPLTCGRECTCICSFLSGIGYYDNYSGEGFSFVVPGIPYFAYWKLKTDSCTFCQSVRKTPQWGTHLLPCFWHWTTRIITSAHKLISCNFDHNIQIRMCLLTLFWSIVLCSVDHTDFNSPLLFWWNAECIVTSCSLWDTRCYVVLICEVSNLPNNKDFFIA